MFLTLFFEMGFKDFILFFLWAVKVTDLVDFYKDSFVFEEQRDVSLVIVNVANFSSKLSREVVVEDFVKGMFLNAGAKVAETVEWVVKVPTVEIGECTITTFYEVIVFVSNV